MFFTKISTLYTLLAGFIRFKNFNNPVLIMLNKETMSYLKNGEKKILKLCNVLVRLIRHLLHGLQKLSTTYIQSRPPKLSYLTPVEAFSTFPVYTSRNLICPILRLKEVQIVYRL